MNGWWDRGCGRKGWRVWVGGCREEWVVGRLVVLEVREDDGGMVWGVGDFM